MIDHRFNILYHHLPPFINASNRRRREEKTQPPPQILQNLSAELCAELVSFYPFYYAKLVSFLKL